MTEYRDNGSRLGWLLDPSTHQVEIYRPAQPVEVLSAPATLSGEDILPGFTLGLQAIFTDAHRSHSPSTTDDSTPPAS